MNHETVAMACAAIVVSMVIVGVGYGIEYAASTYNADNTLDIVYMEFRLNDQGSSTFTFGEDPEQGTGPIAYYRDRAVDGTITYRSNTIESNTMKLNIVGVGATHVNTVATVKLAAAQTAADITMQIYTNEACTVPYGGPITLTAAESQITGGLTTDTNYWCKLTVTVKTATLDAAPSGSIQFDVVFYAVAEAE